MDLLALPETVLMDIFEWLPYDEVAKKREVCTRFNYIGQQVLNAGFNKIIQRHAKNFKRIKSMLPRRESERRNHGLARHSDILFSIETRISMLTMTYSKFIDLNICCFIPGRVLDEIDSILRLLSSTTKPLRPHEVLQELRDISSMAIEHFDDKIAVNFKIEHRKQLAESTVAAAAANGARLVVCGTLGDISVTVKRSSVTEALRQQPIVQFNSVPPSVSNPNQDSSQESSPNTAGNQRIQSNKRTPSVSNSNQQSSEESSPNTARYQPILYNQRARSVLVYKTLLKKVISLEIGRKIQDRRLQDALGHITELTTQVSEMKRQLEDVVANMPGTNSLKRQNSINDDTISLKKPKMG